MFSFPYVGILSIRLLLTLSVIIKVNKQPVEPTAHKTANLQTTLHKYIMSIKSLCPLQSIHNCNRLFASFDEAPRCTVFEPSL